MTGLEWRKCGRYMPRLIQLCQSFLNISFVPAIFCSGCVGNVLATWCRDHICRIWCETPFPEAPARAGTNFVPGDNLGDNQASQESTANETKRAEDSKRQQKRLKDTRKKILRRLKHLRYVGGTIGEF